MTEVEEAEMQLRAAAASLTPEERKAIREALIECEPEVKGLIRMTGILLAQQQNDVSP